MTDLNDIKQVYLVGVGGIGMSALARYFNANGRTVAGYDRAESRLTDALISEGISISFRDETSQIPDEFISDNSNTLVIRTPAVPMQSAILQHFLSYSNVLKRSEVLGLITKEYRTVAIAGTHGKTTISCMVAHLLNASGYGCNAFLGGIASNFSSNVLLDPMSDTVVVEADEYDRSFLQLDPDIVTISSIDADHLDIYGAEEQMREAYQQLADKTRPNGKLIVQHSVGQVIVADHTYGVEIGDFKAEHLRVENGESVFDLVWPDGSVEDIRLPMPGRHNVENACVALAVGLELGVDPSALKQALSQFKGISRRFEYLFRSETVNFIDDYAHHPTEIEACINAVREVHPGKKITGVFQPHLFSRTRDHSEEFAKSLQKLDELILLEIYPAREEPIPGVDSTMLLNKVELTSKSLIPKNELVEDLRERELEVLLTMGAGDIDRLLKPIQEMLDQQKEA